MKNTKRAFLSSLLALLLCITMFIGSTFAWFTDSVVSSGNKIVAGNLKVDLEMLHKELGVWYSVKNDQDPIFYYEYWEPGYTDVTFLRIENEGNLALKWEARFISDAAVSKLAEVIDVYVLPSETPLSYANATRDLDGWTKVGTLDQFINTLSETTYGELDKGEVAYLGIALHMQEEAGNEYQGIGLEAFDIKVVATQLAKEEDSFGPDYDEGAQWPDLPEQNTASAPITLDDEGRLTSDVTLTSADGTIVATVPAGTKFAQGTSSADLNVNKLAQSGANITLEENEETRSFDVHVQDLATDNTAVISIAIAEFLPIGLNMGNYKLYHVEDTATVEMTLLADGETPVHNSFNYDPATGDVVLHLASFSEVALVADTTKAWKGNRDYSWYTNAVAPIDGEAVTEYTIANADQLAALSAIVGGMDGQTQDSFAGKTIKLVADINLGDKESENNPNLIFYPIGYYNSEGTYERTNTAITSGLRNFEGTFDGNGNTIENFYHNTWEMKGDHNWYTPEEQYYRDGMGLFGRVYGGTIKNLTVKNFSSDGEIATTGVIAAYADGATFENIAIFDCNPRVYNIGNGGIVGCVGWYAKEANLKTTFKNITVDNSNKISALWGSYDVACGGIVGQYYPTSGQSSADYPVNAGIDFVNCHIAAQMDVYNDVCANYQYYAYRYTGMLIGSVRENVTIDGHVYPKMDGITAENCTVHFGTWNDYYYCEFEKNGHPSYSGPDDYKFSRIPHSEINFTDSNGNGIIDTDDERASVTGCKHAHTEAENNQAVYLQFNNLVTGYGWGVTTKVVGELAGVTILDREVANSVEKFEGKLDALTTDRVYTIDEIFSYIENCGVKVIDGAVNVTITNLDEKGNVIATFTRGKEWNEGTISFENTGNIEITIQDYYFCTATTITAKVTGRVAEEKFDIVMNNGDFLHRVGNVGTVALDKLFKAKDGSASIGAVSVTVEAVNGTSASGTYSNNAIQFSGTGVVKVTIKDDDTYCTPTVLYLEVVDATNATGAEDATSNNVVLLNDISGGFTVSDGYAFYGNGFKVTCSGKGTYLNNGGLTRGYVNVETGGILDNVQVICDIYPNAFVYAEEVKVSSNLDKEASTSDRSRYMYQLSAIAVSGDGSVVANCYAYGGRNNIYVGGGNVTIENTVTECGTLANIQIAGIKDSAINTITLKDITTIQYKNPSTYDSTKIMIGFGIMVGDNESTANPNIILQGDLKQYNWVTNDDTSVSNAYAKTAIQGALEKTEYVHTINGKTAVNMGIAYLNAKTTAFPAENDQRTNKQEIPYVMTLVKINNQTGYVYSISGSKINETDRYNAKDDGVTPYKPNAQRDIVPKPTFSLGNQTVNGEDRYLTGDINGITARYEKGQEAFTLDITKLMTATKYGSACTVNAICIDPNGNTLSGTVTLNKAGTYTLKFTVVDTIFYYLEGEQVVKVDKTIEYTYTVLIEVTIAEPAIADATITISNTSITGEYTNASADGSKNLSFKLLEGVSVTDAGSTFDLKGNGGTANITYSATSGGYGNAFGGVTTITVTYKDGQVLTMKIKKISGNTPGDPKTITYDVATGLIKSSKQLAKDSCTEQKWQAYEYSFKGINGKTVTSTAIVNITVPKNTDGCVSPDTLITLADGTQVRVDSLTGSEELLVWNMETGKFDKAPIMFLDSDAEAEYEVIKLRFSDGTEVKVIYEHGFWDYDLNRYVYLDRNAEQYIGHTFAKQNGDELEKVQLVDVVIEKEMTTAWSPVTVGHLCYFVNGMLSMPGGVGGLFNIFEVDPETMTYDWEQLEKDIETYGLFTYEELNAICPLSEEMFNAAGGAYLKISIGKGNLTMDELVYMITRYSVFFE